jgi:hypothetical protein
MERIAHNAHDAERTLREAPNFLCASYRCGHSFASCCINGACKGPDSDAAVVAEPWLSAQMKSQSLLAAYLFFAGEAAMCNADGALLQSPPLLLCCCTCGMAFLCHRLCKLPSTNFPRRSTCCGIQAASNDWSALPHKPISQIQRQLASPATVIGIPATGSHASS